MVLYEVANTLRYNEKIAAADIESVLDNMASLGIEIIVLGTMFLKEAVQLSFRYDITLYDAVYAALAKSLECPFVTADRKLLRKLSSLPFVQSLF